jgi:hypothetical protein
MFFDPHVLGDSAMQNTYYAGWGTLALINANLGQLKGDNGLAWFLLSLIVGPIATSCCSSAARPTPRRGEPRHADRRCGFQVCVSVDASRHQAYKAS